MYLSLSPFLLINLTADVCASKISGGLIVQFTHWCCCALGHDPSHPNQKMCVRSDFNRRKLRVLDVWCSCCTVQHHVFSLRPHMTQPVGRGRCLLQIKLKTGLYIDRCVKPMDPSMSDMRTVTIIIIIIH